MATKCYKIMQMHRGIDGQGFDKTHQTFTGKVSKIDETLAETYNKNCMDSGKLYIVDEEMTRKYFPNSLPKAEKKKEVEEEKEEEVPQTKYDKRKEKVLSLGYTFDSDSNTFLKDDEVMFTAQELVDMSPVKYGKLIK